MIRRGGGGRGRCPADPPTHRLSHGAQHTASLIPEHPGPHCKSVPVHTPSLLTSTSCASWSSCRPPVYTSSSPCRGGRQAGQGLERELELAAGGRPPPAPAAPAPPRDAQPSLRPASSAPTPNTQGAAAHLDRDLFAVVVAPRPLHRRLQVASVFQERQRARQTCGSRGQGREVETAVWVHAAVHALQDWIRSMSVG